MSDHENHSDHPVSPHEKSDADIGSVVRFGIGVVVLIVVASAAMMLLFKFLEARPQAAVSPLANKREVPPAPRLQVSPVGDLQGLRAGEARTLTSYGWIDKPTGVVRIPIDRAITLLVEKGFPTKEQEKSKKETRR